MYFLKSNQTKITTENNPLIECYKLNLVAIYCLIIFILSLILNSILLVIFYMYKEFRNTLNNFMITLITINLIGSILEFPLIILSNFYCR